MSDRREERMKAPRNSEGREEETQVPPRVRLPKSTDDVLQAVLPVHAQARKSKTDGLGQEQPATVLVPLRFRG